MDYVALANKSKKLITKYGSTARLIQTTNATFNAILGSCASSVTTSCNINLLIKNPIKNSNSYQDGTLITKDDKLIMISNTSTLTPALGDIVNLSNIKFSIQAIKPFIPASNIIFYDALLRK